MAKTDDVASPHASSVCCTVNSFVNISNNGIFRCYLLAKFSHFNILGINYPYKNTNFDDDSLLDV